MNLELCRRYDEAAVRQVKMPKYLSIDKVVSVSRFFDVKPDVRPYLYSGKVIVERAYVPPELSDEKSNSVLRLCGKVIE